MSSKLRKLQKSQQPELTKALGNLNSVMAALKLEGLQDLPAVLARLEVLGDTLAPVVEGYVELVARVVTLEKELEELKLK